MKTLITSLFIAAIAMPAFAGNNNANCAHQNREGRQVVKKDNEKRVASLIGKSAPTTKKRQKVYQGVKGG